MFHKIKNIFHRQNKDAVQQQQVFDASQKKTHSGTSFQSSLTPEERRRRIESAAQITVEKYGPIIERLSKE